MQVTLEQIVEQQSALTEMIETFKTQLQKKPEFYLPEMTIQMSPDEDYAGIIVGKEGESSYHLILLAGDEQVDSWNDAKKFAKKCGGELPTRREQSLLFANLKDKFQEAWYWSSEEHAQVSDYAWYQGFGSGYQYYWDKYDDGSRARAVRRVII